MKCDWKMVSVQDLIDAQMIEEPKDGNHGNIHPKSTDYLTQGIPFIMANDLVNGRVDYQHCAYISEKQANTLSKGFSHPGDVLLTHKATIGRTAIVTDEYETIILTPQVTYYRTKKGILNRYLKYYFDSAYFQNILANWAGSGSTRAYLGITSQKKLPILLPPLATQKKIAKILSALDDKIECNNQINKNLEEQAQLLYKSWFVDFEPFGGKIPNDWMRYKLSDFLPVITGKKNANISSKKGKYPFFSCSQDIAWTENYSFEGDSILVAGNGDFNVKFYNGKFEAYQRTYVLIPYNSKYTSWLYHLIKYNLKQITSASRGSVVKFITKGNLENFTFYAPKNLNNFKIVKVFDTINNIILANTKENLNLSNIRDTLLSKLMSGEIDVADIDISMD